LVITYDNGKTNDRFRGRVIFPVHTLSGKVVAFGGRVLKKDEKTAKYVNSPESEIYRKSYELYGIYFAKQAIVKADRCFLVEGYTDVISMHQAGIENVVSSSGTALTQGQIRLIKRFTNNITILYDGDAAGIKAALRGIDLLLEEGMNVKVVLLPDGEDPDSFARKHNASQFSDFIKKEETDFIRFKTQLLLNEAGNDPIKRSSLINDIIRTIAIIPDNIIRSVYIRECSTMMEIEEQVLLNETNKIRLSQEERKQPQPPVTNYQSAPVPLPQEPIATTAEAGLQQPEDGFVKISSVRSPFEVYESALVRYIVRYGEHILFDYFDEELQQQIVMKVAEYIYFDLKRDDIDIQTPLFKQILEEAALKCKEEGFIANRFFLAHPESQISQLAANLLSEKYQLSKYHTKYKDLETEESKLPQLIPHEIFALKNAYIQYRIKEILVKMKETQHTGDMEKALELQRQFLKLNEMKDVLSKQLGERIVLKM